MGIVLLVIAQAAAADALPTVWKDFHEVQGTAVELPAPGPYDVWVWLRQDASITIGEKRLPVRVTRGENDPEYVWRKAGAVDTGGAAVDVALDQGIASIVLTKDSGFDPVQAIKHRRVLDQPGRVVDQRAARVRHTDTVFTMPHFGSREEWEPYAERLRQRILLSSGLYPLPERTPLNAQLFGRITRDDYTIEKVYFEAWPGFYVTGNLYRPIGTGPFPAVVGPHGHWEKGRLENSDRGSVPGRHITFARMGIVAFSYDMIGYNDSKQFKHNWGENKHKLWGIHPYALQLWSAIRAADFLASLPEVDPDRIAATGASGGGTQTFSLMAVDPRIQVAAPVNMISSTMQGGCLCENAPLLRLDNSNMEIGALMAPRPLLLVSATGDWTRETPRVEYPAIRSIFGLYGAEDRVKNVHIDAPHNYNQASREAVYTFFGKWLLNEETRYAGFNEPPFEVEDEGDLRVFPDDLPQGAADSEAVIQTIINLQQDRLQAHYPRDAAGLAAFRTAYAGTLAQVMGAEVPEPNDLAPERTGLVQGPELWIEQWILRRPAVDDAVPAILYRAASEDMQAATLIVREGGKGPAVQFQGPLAPEVSRALAQDHAALTIDVFLQGEHHDPFAATSRAAKGAFGDTFEPTDTACQVQDILTALAFLRSRRDLTGDIEVVGVGRAGILALFAAAIDGGVTSLDADLANFNSADDAAWVEQYYVPSLRSVGDVGTAGVLLAPISVRFSNVHASFPLSIITEAYRAAGAEDRIAIAGSAAGSGR